LIVDSSIFINLSLKSLLHLLQFFRTYCPWIIGFILIYLRSPDFLFLDFRLIMFTNPLQSPLFQALHQVEPPLQLTIRFQRTSISHVALPFLVIAFILPPFLSSFLSLVI
jgi:hypothetical protein